MLLAIKIFGTWLWRAWPVLLLIPIVIVHLLYIHLPCFFVSSVLNVMCWGNDDINKLLSLVMQLVGGLLVLYSIDSNIKTLRNKNLFYLIKKWIKEFPFIKRKPIELKGANCYQQNTCSTGSIRTYKKPETLEEKVDCLAKEIEWLKEDHKNSLREIHRQMDFINGHIDKTHQEHSKAINSLNVLIDDLSLSALKVQIFGVILVLYGSICGYLV